MPTPLSKRLEVIERRQRVADMYLQGWTQQAIAKELGTVQSAVCNDLKIIKKEWRESAIRDFDAMRDEELRRLERVEREAWGAWERSQKPEQSAKILDQAASGKGHKTVKSQVGNPRFLEVVLKCIETRRTMLGLDAPTKIAPTTPDGQPLSIEQRQTVVNAILIEQFGMTALAEEPGHVDTPASSGLPALPPGRGTAEVEPAGPLEAAEPAAEETPSPPGRVLESDV